MKSSKLSPAHCRSSKTMTTGSCSARRSKHPPAREQLPACQAGLGDAEQRPEPRDQDSRSEALTIQRSRPASSFEIASSKADSSGIPSRWRTISASAQYATPSP